jgi:hypothetical protein
MLINHVSGAWSAPAPAVSHTLPLLLTTHTSPLLQVDRSDTHLASAVIQIDQKTDENGGWPLEVMDADGNVSEIYLQANELVLYEGARFRHGRPMRFAGDDFANIFSHFSPEDWKGAGKSPRYGRPS